MKIQNKSVQSSQVRKTISCLLTRQLSESTGHAGNSITRGGSNFTAAAAPTDAAIYNYRWHKTIARNIQRAALPSYLLANSFGESTLKPLVSNDVSYSSSVIASAFSSPSPCSSYLVLSEVMTGWSGLTSRVRLPRMYSMARVSPMACSHELVIRMGATICSTTQPIPMQSMALLQAHIQIKDIHPLLHAANRHQTLRSYSLCTFDTFASC